MKKLLFIMILATIFIPVTQTGASNKEMNMQYKPKAVEVQSIVKQDSNGLDAVNSEKLLQAKKLKSEERIKKISRMKTRLSKKRISSERRDRLFGLLLLAHGGQR
jgi:hypothetical protein